MCTTTFIIALFTVAKSQVSIHRWMDKQNMIHTMEYYSVLKRKVILTYATTWINFEDIILNKITVTKRQIVYDSTYMRHLE